MCERKNTASSGRRWNNTLRFEWISRMFTLNFKATKDTKMVSFLKRFIVFLNLHFFFNLKDNVWIFLSLLLSLDLGTRLSMSLNNKFRAIRWQHELNILLLQHKIHMTMFTGAYHANIPVKTTVFVNVDSTRVICLIWQFSCTWQTSEKMIPNYAENVCRIKS